MEVVNWSDVIEPETEEHVVSLRGRLPRQRATTVDDGESAISPTFKDDVSSKSSETSGEDSQSSGGGEEKTNGVSHGENGNGNGVSEAKSTNGHSKLDDRYDDFLVSDENLAEPEVNFEANDLVVLHHQNEVEIVEDEKDLTGFSALTSNDENGVDTSSVNNETVRYMEAQLRKKIEEEFRELYLEKLSDKQGGHEFYCPNCKACITKVLVRERESEEAIVAATQPQEVERRFRCTSCLSFLIPIGNWLFPRWKIVEEDQEENVSNQVSSGGLREPLLDQNSQATSSQTPVPEQPVENSVTTTIETHLGDRNIQVVSGKAPENPQPVAITVTTTTETMEQNSERITAVIGQAEKRPWTSILFGQRIHGAVKGKTPVAEEESGTVPAPIKSLPNDAYENGKAHDYQLHLPVSESAGTIVSAAIIPLESSSDSGVKLEVSVPSQEFKGEPITPLLDPSRGDIVTVTTKPSEIDVAVSAREFPPLQEVIIHSGPKTDGTVSNIDAGLAGAILPQNTPAVIAQQDTRSFSDQDSPKSWEIVKSIVYGGLVESITSLGIVTSAASSGATTLNIMALSLANLIGGLFVIVHNIWELRDDQSTERCSRTNRVVNKYHGVLGRRENFLLHATFVILSFIFFGLVPPAVYGLTFRETDDQDLKLAAVGIASLVSIAILAIGKAYTQTPNKYVKTITYYIIIGFAVSAASFFAGELIKPLLEKINSFEQTPALSMPLLTMGASKGGSWGSY